MPKCDQCGARYPEAGDGWDGLCGACADKAEAPPVTRKQARQDRRERLLPGGVPRWVRCYDTGEGVVDRYSVVFTGRYPGKARGRCEYVSMSARPFHPQGFGQHGEHDHMIDVNDWGFAPALGRSNHLGTRITFETLPEDCQKLVMRDYLEIWKLEG